MKRFLILSFSSVFGLGYMPFSKGTWGTAFAFLIWFLFLKNINILAFLIFVFVFIIFSIIVSDLASKEYKVKDCQHIVIDEVAGYFVAVIGFVNYLEYLTYWGVAAFILFRFFDIFKPYPIKYFERISGGLGVVADDLMAGVYSSLILNISFYFLY